MLAQVVRGIASLLLIALPGCQLGNSEIMSLRDAGGRLTEPDPVATLDTGVAPHGFPDAGLSPPPGPVEGEVILVYAHSGKELFGVDPEKLEFTRIGAFSEMVAGQQRAISDVTDIAIDRDGRLVGTTYHRLLDIDPKTAACKMIGTLPGEHSFNGLSWIRAPGGVEQLLATSQDGSVYRIDPATGGATQVGALGGGLGSSGDLVSVDSYGTLVTVTGGDTDRLARIDPATGQAVIIGATSFKKIWGLGFWKNKVFGFTTSGQFILIDPKTGMGTLVQTMPSFEFWGAGVTTSVPVIP
jgi:hypothetical protein